ncbi:hypothetical protein RRG08_043163 [Elysia crispata]|uniref:Uncharacterized protein n=1 Tax=Elysia crispata TaxID=231223 RepID=A0AAE0XTG6_9GAST|nr:hypothetical protein RRG08_043163 [Elysia crispata]
MMRLRVLNIQPDIYSNILARSSPRTRLDLDLDIGEKGQKLLMCILMKLKFKGKSLRGKSDTVSRSMHWMLARGFLIVQKKPLFTLLEQYTKDSWACGRDIAYKRQARLCGDNYLRQRILKHGRMSAAATSERHDQRPEIAPERTAIACVSIGALTKRHALDVSSCVLAPFFSCASCLAGGFLDVQKKPLFTLLELYTKDSWACGRDIAYKQQARLC